MDLPSILGGAKKNKNGKIVSAQAISSSYFIVNNEIVSQADGIVDEKV